MSTAGHILIGGGSGFIGNHLCKLLKSNGYGTTIISRMPGPQRISWSDLQARGLPRETTAVVNLAGQNVMDFKQRWTAGFKQNVYNSRVNTTSSLAKAINEAENKPKAFVAISGVGGYKPDRTKEYSEESELKKFDFFSELCQEWEKASKLDDKSESKCRRVIVRSGVVLGRNGGMIKQLYVPFSFGLGGPTGNGKQFLPWIHIEDLAGLIVFAIETPNVTGILNGVAPQPITNKDFSDAFGKALKRPAVIPMPAFVMNCMLGSERAKMITEGQKVIPKRTLSVGFKYKYPTIDDACRAIVKGS